MTVITPATKSWREQRPTKRNRGRLYMAELALKQIRAQVDGELPDNQALDEIADIITAWEARRYPETTEADEL